MTDAFSMLAFEEGFSEKPYIDTEGYPTAGIGLKLGPKGSPLSNYTFTVPRTVADVWLRCYLDRMLQNVDSYPNVADALRRLTTQSTGAMYSDPRTCVLLSMCYQMGVPEVAAFANTLGYIASGDYTNAAANMLQSKWAKQTPQRAARHAEQMRAGLWAPEYS